MSNKKGFIIPTAMIIIIGLSVVVGSVLVITTTNLKNIGSKDDSFKALNIAEAGLHKALWYLATEPADGGMGIAWRPEDHIETFGSGCYSITVKDDTVDPDLFVITVTGTYKNVTQILEVLAGVTFAGRFVDYALHSDQAVIIDPDADISGDVYADGDVTVEAGAAVDEGTVSVSEGHSVTGEGEYVEGANLEEEPPVIDYDFYADKIAIAAAGGPGVINGNRTVVNYNLDGRSVYINGILTIEGTIAGNGEIISSKSIDLRNGANFLGRVRIIAGDNMRVFAGVNYDKAAMLYAENLIIIRDNFDNRDDVMAALTPGTLRIGSNAKMKGIFFGGEIKIGENSILGGNVIGGTTSVLEIGPGVRLIYINFIGSVPDGFATRIKIYRWLKK